MTQEVCNIFDVQHEAQCLTVVQDSRVGSTGGHNLKLRATRLESKIQEPGRTKYQVKEIQITRDIRPNRKGQDRTKKNRTE